MTTANPSLYAASNTIQDCFEITYPFTDVPQYVSKEYQLLAFPNETANIGTDITATTDTDPTYGYFTSFQLNSGLTYKIEARAFPAPNSKQPLIMAIANGSESLGEPVPLGSTFTGYISPVTDAYLQVVVAAIIDGSVFMDYPAQVVNATISIQVVDGFDVV